MTQKLVSGIFLLLLTLSMTAPAYATKSDVGKEKRWAEQVIDGLLDGDELWLTDPDGHRFLGILTEGDAGLERAVILVHGIGVHPNWPDVIFPLRAGLLEHGTTTLSIQMPILPNEAEEREYGPLYDEAPGRLQAAVDYLQQEGFGKIVIVGHSMGASMTAFYLSQSSPAAVDSTILIGLGRSESRPQNIEWLSGLKVPILDLYGSADLETVLNTVGQRAEAAGKNMGGVFRQIKTDGANHFFQGHEAALVRHVIDWLESR